MSRHIPLVWGGERGLGSDLWYGIEWAWWYTCLILGSWRQEGQKFKIILCYIVTSRSACLKNKHSNSCACTTAPGPFAVARTAPLASLGTPRAGIQSQLFPSSDSTTLLHRRRGSDFTTALAKPLCKSPHPRGAGIATCTACSHFRFYTFLTYWVQAFLSFHNDFCPYRRTYWQ